MAEIAFPFYAATPDEVDALALLVDLAGEGLPLYLWAQMAEPGETAWDVGRRRARRVDGSFSYRNAVVRRAGDAPDEAAVACLIGYGIAEEPVPVGDDMPAMFVPLQELENLAPGTWYVNVLAALPDQRGRGLGASLLRFAEDRAQAAGHRGMSLIVADANTGARRLYERHGYTEQARRAMVKDAWVNPSHDWVLLLKAFTELHNDDNQSRG